MSSTSDKVKGMANEAVGKIKQAVGKATGNTELEVKGKLQEKRVKPSKWWVTLKMPSAKTDAIAG